MIINNNILTIGEKLKYLIENKGITPYILSKETGIDDSVISRLLNGITIRPSIKNCNIIANYFNISRDWLLTGKEEMKSQNILNEKKAQYGNAKIINFDDHLISAPLISQYAYGGYLRGFSDPEYLHEQPVYTARIKHNGGNYVAFEVRGDSMDDNTKRSICEGDLILGCELKKEYWKLRLHIPKIFIIVHETEGIIVKEIVKHDVERGIITCHSWNPLPEYEDFELNLNEVMQLFYIKEITRNNKF